MVNISVKAKNEKNNPLFRSGKNFIVEPVKMLKKSVFYTFINSRNTCKRKKLQMEKNILIFFIESHLTVRGKTWVVGQVFVSLV